MSGNTRTGITKACFYEPNINPSYLDMAHANGESYRFRRPAGMRQKLPPLPI